MASRQRRQSQTFVQRVSLNPEVERAELASAQVALSDPKRFHDIERLWFAVLSSGLALYHETCTVLEFRAMLKRSGLSANEKEFNSHMSHFDDILQTTAGGSGGGGGAGGGGEGRPRALSIAAVGAPAGPPPVTGLDLVPFLRILFRIGCEKFRTGDHLVALDAVLKVLVAWTAKVHTSNAVDPAAAPDEGFLEMADVDAVLYVYDAVFDRMFKRYRNMDTHGNRELTLEQAIVLDQFMELEEIREFLKEFTFFPKNCSWVEMSIASQMACFGQIVVNPARQGTGRQSQINPNVGREFEEQRDKRLSVALPAAPMVASPLLESSPQAVKSGRRKSVGALVGFGSPAGPGQDDALTGQSSSNLGTSAPRAINPLYVEVLPPEFLTTEVLLDKARFMTFVVRLSQMLYHKPDLLTRLPTVASRVEEFLRFARGPYEKIFGHPMDEDCDWAPRGVPTLNGGTSTSAISPGELSCAGGPVVVSGANFCEKRGCFVRLTIAGGSDPPHAASPVAPPPGSQQGATAFETIDAAAVIPGTMVLRCKDVTKRRCVAVIPPLPPAEVHFDCQFRDGNYRVTSCRTSRCGLEASNDRVVYSLTVPQQILTLRKQLPPYDIDEDVAKRILKTFSTTCAVGQKYNSKYLVRNNWRRLKTMYELRECPITEDERDIFFVAFAELHDGAPEFALDFRGFLRCVSRTFFEMYGEEHWMDHIPRLATMDGGEKARGKAEAPPEEKRELVRAKEALDNIEKKLYVELDVYLGPVLCGMLTNRSGPITSCALGSKVIVAGKHTALSYDHYDDVSTERSILGVLDLSMSFLQALQRLNRAGFEFAAHTADVRSRKPPGRCWRIFANDRASNAIGAMWDYPGQFSCLEWQPADHELRHPTVTLAFYTSDDDVCFLQGYLAFTKATDAASLRTALAQYGMVLNSQLFTGSISM